MFCQTTDNVVQAASRCRQRRSRILVASRQTALAMLLSGLAAGCHDGPLYALKHVNPYFTMREWKRDRALGVTDHQRRRELIKLTEKIAEMPPKDQAFWKGHLGRIMENDPSAEMRRLAVLAASRIEDPAAIDLIEAGLGDESVKVQMASCSALGSRQEPRATQLLASTLGATTETDVKNSAIAALGNHQGQMSMESLRIVLDEQDPATIDLAMSSLRSVMGKDYGEDPQQWIAAIDAERSSPNVSPDGAEQGGIRFAERDDDSRRE